jgi:hypothetical protein
MVDALKIDTSRVLDSRLYNKNEVEYTTGMGASHVNYKRQASNSSSGNTSSITFNPVINSTSILDRKMFIEIKFLLTFTGTTTGGNLLKSGYDAPRSFQAIVSNTQLNINTQSVTQESRYLYHWLAHTNNIEMMKNSLTLSSYMASPDYTQSYEVADGSQFNSLSDFNTSSVNNTGRGMYNLRVISNTPTGASVELIMYDYIYLSPMVYDNSNLYQGIPNISSLELQYTLQQIERIWSHSNAGGGNITSLDVAIPQAFLNFIELTPGVQTLPPPITLLPFVEYDRRLTNTSVSIPAGATSTDLFSGAYTLNTIPRRCVIFAKERASDIQTLSQLINKPDVYGSIQKISIQFANQNSLFSTATPEQLYLISSRNGYAGSLESWKGETQVYDDVNPLGYNTIGLSGSVFIFDFSTDVSVSDPSLLPGVASNVDFQITQLVVKNTSDRNISYDVEVYFVYDSVIEISLGQSRQYRSLLLPVDVLDYPIVQDSDVEEAGVSGQGFKSMLKGALSGLRKNRLLKKGATVLADAFIDPPERDMLRKYTGVGVVGNGVVGNGVVGNALVKKRNLRERM